MRDLLKDLELCQKATKEPWEIEVWYVAVVVNDGSDPDWNPPACVPKGKCSLCDRKLVREYKDKLGRTIHLHRVPFDGDWRNIYSADGIKIVGNYDFENGGVCTTREDAEFIISSRTGWPHAIERALKAEAEVEKLRAEVERLRRREETILRWLDDSCCPPRMLGSRCPERSCGQCFREALDREEARERENDGGRDSA